MLIHAEYTAGIALYYSFINKKIYGIITVCFLPTGYYNTEIFLLLFRHKNHNDNEAEMNYESVIGLEVHVQLLTRSKMFFGCANRYGAEPNSLTCPGPAISGLR